MKIHVKYAAQARRAINLAGESIELPPPATVADLLCHLARRHEPLRPILLKPNSTADVHPSLLLFVNDEQAVPARELRDNDTLTLMPPIAGG